MSNPHVLHVLHAISQKISTQGANLAGQQLTGRLLARKGTRLGAFQELLLGIPLIGENHPKTLGKQMGKSWENSGSSWVINDFPIDFPICWTVFFWWFSHDDVVIFQIDAKLLEGFLGILLKEHMWEPAWISQHISKQENMESMGHWFFLQFFLWSQFWMTFKKMIVYTKSIAILVWEMNGHDSW